MTSLSQGLSSRLSVVLSIATATARLMGNPSPFLRLCFPATSRRRLSSSHSLSYYHLWRIGLLSLLSQPQSRTIMYAMSPSRPQPYQPPAWANRQVLTLPPVHGRLRLGNFPTPLYQLFDYPGGWKRVVAPMDETATESESSELSSSWETLLDRGLTFYVKRDDSSGGVELGGNKVRKLEFLLAEAVASAPATASSSAAAAAGTTTTATTHSPYDSVITIGGEQSNHCRATACAARMVGLEPHLILRTLSRRSQGTTRDGNQEENDDLGFVGNLMVDRLVQSQIYTCTAAEYARLGSVELVNRLAQRLRAQGKHPYCIPVGGSNGLGTWGYIEAVRELLAQWEEHAQALSSSTSSSASVSASMDHIVFACGSGGTAAGITLGIALAFAEKKKPTVHAIGVCDSPDYFYEHTAKIANEMGLVVPPEYESAEAFVRAHCIVHQGKGLGYANSTPSELEFVQSFARATGIVLDPVYSGKALYNFVKFMLDDPETFQKANVVFWHTGGALGLYDKIPEMAKSLQSKAPCQRLDLYGKGIGVDVKTMTQSTWKNDTEESMAPMVINNNNNIVADDEKSKIEKERKDEETKIFEFGANRRNPQWQERSQSWILLVDDDDALRQAVGAFLDQEGYQVTACASAEQALEWLGGRGGNNLPDLIVSDIRMPPGMDGLEFLTRLRQDPSWIRLPVVLLTAKGQTRDRIAGYNAGADAYLPKPFAPDELLGVVDSLLARQKRFSDSSVTLQDLQRDIEDIKSLLQQGGAGAGVGGFVEASGVFLAPDERQVLELLCQGLPNKEIASQTFASTRRVEQLLTSLYRKTGVGNRTELIRWAIRTGTIRLQ